MEVAVSHPLTNVQPSHSSYDSQHSHSYPPVPQPPEQQSRHHQNTSRSPASFSSRRRAEISESTVLAGSAPIDGQDHDRMEGTRADTTINIDDRGGNLPHDTHTELGVDVVGHAHDRIDAEMENNGHSPDEDVPQALANGPSNLQNNGISEEVMDTTPDNPLDGGPTPADGVDPSTHLLDTQMSSSTQLHSNIEGEDLVRITSEGSTINSAGSSQNAIVPTEVQPLDGSGVLHTALSNTPEQREYPPAVSALFRADLDHTAAETVGPTGPATLSPESSVHEEEDDDNSGDQESGEEEDDPFWARLEEDKSEASGEELKEIEQREKARVSFSADDHEHWERVFFEELDDPEYIPGDTGRICWTVRAVNGTPDKPNMAKIMRSPSVLIGGFYWNIKYFPRGNDGTSQLSVYIECSRAPPEKHDVLTSESTHSTAENEEIRDAPPTQQANGEGSSGEDTSERLEPPASETVTEPMVVEPASDMPSGSWHLDIHRAKENQEHWEIAAQIGCVVYNPQEPRVSHPGKSEHHFDDESPDWGWTRFHGPWSEIHIRQPLQRQALLRNDTLSFTAYIRVVKDETGALWWHPTKGKNERDCWDSVAKTGLRAFSVSWDYTSVLNAASSTWFHLHPFRDILCKAYIPDPVKDTHMRPRWLLQETKSLLSKMYDPTTHHSTLSLQRIHEVLKWYGRDSKQVSDVIEMWDVLRELLTAEVCDGDSNGQCEDLFKQLITLRQPDPFPQADIGSTDGDVKASQGSRSPVVKKGARSVQEAVDGAIGSKSEAEEFWRQRSSDFYPSVLQIELERRQYDKKSRRWDRLSHKIELNEEINICSWRPRAGAEVYYTLHSMVVHDGDLEARNFCTIVRPGGPGTKWVKYANRKSRQEVVHVTRKQAIEAHEGVGDDRKGSQPVAYVVIYIRNDLLKTMKTTQPISLPRSQNWTQQARISAPPEHELGELFWHQQLGLPPLNTQHMEAQQAQQQQEGTEKTANLSDPKPTMVPLKIFRSDIFNGSKGKGSIDPWDTRLRSSVSGTTFEIQVPSSATCRDVQKHLATVMKVADTPEQCLLWTINSSIEYGVKGTPHLKRKHGDVQLFEAGYGEGVLDAQHIWLHVVNSKAVSPSSSAQQTSENSQGDQASTPPAAQGMFTSDSGMVLDSTGLPLFSGLNQSTETITLHTADGEDTVMAEPEESSATVERSATSENIQPEIVASESYYPEREIYIFLKTFDAESQEFVGVGTYLVKRTEKIAHITKNLLQLPSDLTYDHWIEYHRYEAQKALAPDRVLEPGTFNDGIILIVQKRLSEKANHALEALGHYPYANDYISYLSLLATDPSLRLPHLTRNYFGADYFSQTVRHGRAHGPGTRIALTGDAYTGTWASGHKHGPGQMAYPNGDTYTGNWVRDFPEGQGEMVYATTGNTYTGGWRRGKRHGKGTMRYEVADEEMALCKICYEVEMDALLFDCGHVVACEECARMVEVCPVCRRDVKAVVRIWRT